MATKWVYMFTEGNATMRNLLGGKGANLAEMTGLGLPRELTADGREQTLVVLGGDGTLNEVVNGIQCFSAARRCPACPSRR